MTSTNERYTVTVPGGVNIRSEPSINGKILGAACEKRDCIVTRLDASRSWGYTDMIICTNGPQSGWISLENMTRGWPCKIVARPGLRLRRNPGSADSSNTVLVVVPHDEIVVVEDVKKYESSVWVKVTYKGQTGWMCFLDHSAGNLAVGVSDIGTCF